MSPTLHNRQSIRLKGYDYTQPGGYFVTICTWHKEPLFGEMVGDQMVQNIAGDIVAKTWLDLSKHYLNVQVDEFVVMPNHFHGILFIIETSAGPIVDVHGLPEIIRGFKTYSARRINLINQTTGIPLWQRNYFEHIIRDNESLARIRRYIQENPIRWAIDDNNPANQSHSG